MYVRMYVCMYVCMWTFRDECSCLQCKSLLSLSYTNTLLPQTLAAADYRGENLRIYMYIHILTCIRTYGTVYMYINL